MFSFSIGAALAALLNLISKGLDFLLPVWYNVIKLIEWFASYFWKGLVIILTNLITLFVIAPLMIASGYYGYSNCKPQVIKNLRKDYKFVPRKTSKPSLYERTKNVYEGMNLWKR